MTEEEAMTAAKVKVLAGMAAGWAVRQVLTGAFLALGGWTALRIIGAI